MIITIECTYSYTKDKKAYFNYINADKSYEKLTNVIKTLSNSYTTTSIKTGCCTKTGFSVMLPKEPLGEIGGIDFKATLGASIAHFKDRTTNSQVYYLRLTLLNLEKVY
jgi:hypothetical protein